MSSEISASVGRWEKGARNLQDDVRTVQRLLKAAAEILEAPEIDPKGVDGEISRPPGTSTLWKRSKPFKAVSRARWTELLRQAARRGPCYWESRRNCQPRWKMFRTFLNGFSLFRLFQPRAGKNGLGHLHHRGRVVPACMPAVISTFPRGTLIHAIADGVVTRGPYPFYCETFALEIDHGTFVARYGEIQSKTEVIAGARVKAGQKIASVGHLVGIQVPSDMLHFELYDKSLSGPLTVASDSGSAMKKGVPFMRRKDLIDPTLKLNQWRENLPPA